MSAWSGKKGSWEIRRAARAGSDLREGRSAITPSSITPEKSYRIVLTIWVVLFASIGIYYFLCKTVLQPDKIDPDAHLAFPLLGLAILLVLWSVRFKTRLGVRKGQPSALGMVQAGYILALVLAETPATLGVVVFVVLGWPHYWIFFAISVVAFILNFPRRDAFEQASS
jgi:hypothetical protein